MILQNNIYIFIHFINLLRFISQFAIYIWNTIESISQCLLCVCLSVCMCVVDEYMFRESSLLQYELCLCVFELILIRSRLRRFSVFHFPSYKFSNHFTYYRHSISSLFIYWLGLTYTTLTIWYYTTNRRNINKSKKSTKGISIYRIKSNDNVHSLVFNKTRRKSNWESQVAILFIYSISFHFDACSFEIVESYINSRNRWMSASKFYKFYFRLQTTRIEVLDVGCGIVYSINFEFSFFYFFFRFLSH